MSMGSKASWHMRRIEDGYGLVHYSAACDECEWKGELATTFHLANADAAGHVITEHPDDTSR